MAQRKKNNSKSTRTKNSKSSSKRSSTKSRNNVDSGRVKILSIFVISLLVSLLLLSLKHEIVNGLFNFYCEPIHPGDYASETVSNAVNLHHLIRENPNNETKLLSERVIWFRRSRTATPKERIRKYSSYDKFCLGTQPDFTLKDEMSNNYQMTFVGFHRYREPDSLFVKIENYYCEIENGRIREIYSVPIGATDKSRINKINLLYKYFFPLILIGVLVIVSIIHFLTSLPEAIFKTIIELLKRFSPI